MALIDDAVRARWIPTRGATPSTALVPQQKVGFPIPNSRLLLGFQGTKTARREGISSPFSDARGCTSPQNSGRASRQLRHFEMIFAIFCKGAQWQQQFPIFRKQRPLL